MLITWKIFQLAPVMFGRVPLLPPCSAFVQNPSTTCNNNTRWSLIKVLKLNLRCEHYFGGAITMSLAQCCQLQFNQFLHYLYSKVKWSYSLSWYCKTKRVKEDLGPVQPPCVSAPLLSLQSIQDPQTISFQLLDGCWTFLEYLRAQTAFVG